MNNDEESSEEEDDSDDCEEEKKEGRPIHIRLANFISYYLKKFWRGIVWLFDSNPGEAAVRRESTLRLENSLEFNRVFRDRINRIVNPENQRLDFPEFSSLYSGANFYSLCEDARRRRKPILVLMIRRKASR